MAKFLLVIKFAKNENQLKIAVGLHAIYILIKGH